MNVRLKKDYYIFILQSNNLKSLTIFDDSNHFIFIIIIIIILVLYNFKHNNFFSFLHIYTIRSMLKTLINDNIIINIY